MNVLLINGSPRAGGNTSRALDEMQRVFSKNGVEVNRFELGTRDVRGCIACGACHRNPGHCALDSDGTVAELAKLLDACDGMVIASPVYYASANGSLISLLDRLFYSTGSVDKRMKVGASVAVARRGGCSATFDELNKYFTISEMPIASSRYWNSVHGAAKGEAEEDLEGLQTMRALAENMTFLMRSIALGKQMYPLPEKEPSQRTNFIR